jgi:hypothetical protein
MIVIRFYVLQWNNINNESIIAILIRWSWMNGQWENEFLDSRFLIRSLIIQKRMQITQNLKLYHLLIWFCMWKKHTGSNCSDNVDLIFILSNFDALTWQSSGPLQEISANINANRCKVYSPLFNCSAYNSSGSNSSSLIFRLRRAVNFSTRSLKVFNYYQLMIGKN